MSDEFNVSTDTETDVYADDSDFDDSEFFEDDEGYEEESEDSSEEVMNYDDWKWAEGLDPSKVQKTWTQYTKTHQEALDIKREAEKQLKELEPIIQLREEVMKDPGLLKAIDAYYNSPARPVEMELGSIKKELEDMKTQVSVEKEFSQLDDWARENGYYDDFPVDRNAVLSHAVENNIPNLKAAYKDMYFDEVEQRGGRKMAKSIQRSRGAKSLRSQKPKDGRTRLGTRELLTMSDEDFIKNYDKILDSYRQ